MNYRYVFLFLKLSIGSLFFTVGAEQEGLAAIPDFITTVDVKGSLISIKINEAFKNRFLFDDFFIEYDKDLDFSCLDYSLLTMPCVTNLITLIWISGNKYAIDSMDKDLFYSLLKLKKLFRAIYPRTSWEGELIPRNIVEHKLPFVIPSTHRALLFSGGLDSTAASFRLKDKQQLLITAWGQSDLPLDDEQKWKRVKKRMHDYATTYGHTCSFIRSNYYAFLKRGILNKLSQEIPNWRILTIEDIGWSGMIAPLLFLKGHPVLSIGSSDTWDTRFPSACFPFIDSLITCAGIRMKHEQFDVSRPGKVEVIVKCCREKNIAKPILRVCSKDAERNCCQCRKCLTTLLSLWILGEDPHEYGFPISYEESLERTQEMLDKVFSARYVDLADIDQLSNLQNKVKQLIKKGSNVDSRLRNLLDFDVQEGIFGTKEFKYQKRLCWQHLHTLFPEVKVPRKYLFSENRRS